MAELIGLIGSSIALVDLAGKITSCVLTIKSRLTEIKDVSNKLSAIMREVDILEPIVEAMSREFSEDNCNLSAWNDGTALLCIEYCEKALTDLSGVLRDLAQEVGTSRKLKRYKATMKAIIKGDVLDRCHTRLQSAVRFLSLTQQWYIIALLKAQPTRIVEHLSHQSLIYRPESQINAIASPVLEPPQVRPRHWNDIRRAFSTRVVREELGTPRYTNLWNFGPFGSIAWRYYQEEGKAYPRDFNFVARLQANYWFASRVWDIQASRAATGWTLKLNIYCIQPETAPVFCCARKGDLNGILRLIDQRKASLQDHTPSGQSLLHLAAHYGHFDLFKTLVTSGLDFFENDDGLKVNPCEAMIIFGLQYGTDVPALHRFYQNIGIYIESGLLITVHTPAYLFEAFCSAPPEMMTNIIPSVLPGFYERLNLEERITYYKLDNPDGHTDTFQFLINPAGSVNQDDVSNLQQKNTCLLTLLAFRYGPMSMKETSYHTRSWRTLARKVIKMTSDLSYQSFGLDPTFQSRECMNKGHKFNPGVEFIRRNQPLTPLFTALSYFHYETEGHLTPTCVRDLKRSMETTFAWWLEDLAACRVNLIEYGRREKRIFLRNEKRRRAYYYCGRRIEDERSAGCTFEDTIRLVDFDYGAEPSNWQLHWDAENERYVGDFWSSIESA
ncbi:hypothetical protein F5Y12DRAFT_720685 [Xylaria sp. FL1777]|nr:hypothetical protein F5Y12DRAFT_720685 [Xylaria sp. FL1777]